MSAATLFDPAPFTMPTVCPVCSGEHADACPYGVALELDLFAAGRLVVLVPCSAAKALPHPDDADSTTPATVENLMATMPAGELYTGSFHRYARHHAARLGADVVIASALHGLVSLDHELGGYNVSIEHAERRQMGMPRLTSRTRHQAERLGLLEPGVTVVAFLPKRYARAIAAAGVPFVDVLAGSRGIGEQRGRIARLTRAELLQ